MKKIIADLHLHSKYSRAVSQKMTLPNLALWGEKKGIDLLATADFTHPLWLKEIELFLKEDRPGIYRSKENPSGPMFVIGGEISSVYRQGGKGRRIHNLVLLPHLRAAQKINQALIHLGANLSSDGRPIISLSGEELAELVFEQEPEAIIIPCHVWTPWFSLYGTNSGFDSINDCFGRYQKQIFAVETGLSSDPAMNWEIKELEKRQIVSFSDAHSPAKLGREATVLEGEKTVSFSYFDLKEAIENSPKKSWRISFTIEFYPQEGKYHYNGHRHCHITRSPAEILKKGSLCPVCGKPLTLGVLYRVKQLSGQKVIPIKKLRGETIFNFHPQNRRPPYVMLVPLMEIIAEAETTPVASPKTEKIYEEMIERLGPEFKILLETPLEKIKSLFGERIGEGINRVRKQKLTIKPGYDGVFGQVKIWPKEEEKKKEERQMNLF